MTLFLFVAKLAWLALRPSNLLWLATAATLLWMRRQHVRRRGQVGSQVGEHAGDHADDHADNHAGDRPAGPALRPQAVLVGLALMFLLLASPLGHMPLWVLEQRFPTCDFEQLEVDAVAVLGGAIKTNLSNQTGQLAVGNSGERLITLARLAQAPDAPLLIASGGTFALQGRRNEAEWLSQWLEQIGVPEGRVAFEGASLNTYQNALGIRDLLPEQARHLAVVTSAFHMPRAVGVFRAAGFEVTACPVDFRVNLHQAWGYPNAAEALGHLDQALHELLGLAAYRWTGRSQSLWPAL